MASSQGQLTPLNLGSNTRRNIFEHCLYIGNRQFNNLGLLVIQKSSQGIKN